MVEETQGDIPSMTNEVRQRLLQHWFIGDMHLGDKNIIIHEQPNRWRDIEHHDTTIIGNCMIPAASNRTLWLVGDVGKRKADVENLMTWMTPRWGAVNLIQGNHDHKAAWALRHLFKSSHEAKYLKVDSQHKFYISHFAHRVWWGSHRGTYHVYAHSHGNLPGVGRSLDCGAFCHDFRPISAYEIVQRMATFPVTGSKAMLHGNVKWFRTADQLPSVETGDQRVVVVWSKGWDTWLQGKYTVGPRGRKWHTLGPSGGYHPLSEAPEYWCDPLPEPQHG